MNKMRRVILSTLLLMSITSVLSQSRVIRGKITDSLGAPLAGATVLSDQKSKSAVSDSAGNYAISVDRKATTLIVSYVGYITKTILISNNTTLDVIMYPSKTGLEDIVVIGYGTQRKSHLTGAISKYSSERLDEIPFSRLDQALQGKIAGLSVQNLSSEAGATPRIRVRGLSSINAGADPLVVVDGHPVPDGLAFVNMADVESVEVLKDAASAAIYGSRGATGVILITTKSGKADRTRYNVQVSSGFRSAYKLQDIMTVTDYVNKLFYEASLRATDPTVPASQVNRVSTAERSQYIIENTIMGSIPTDWQKEAIRSAAGVSNVQISASGGTKTVKYFLSGAYNKDQGLMYHSDYDKASIRGKLETQLSKRIKFNLNINPTYTKRERPATSYIDFVRFPSFLPAQHTEASAAFVSQLPAWSNIRPGDWTQVGHFNGRIYSGLMPDGTTWTATSAVDPFSSSNNTPKSVMETRNIDQSEYRVLTSGDININLAKGLDFKALGSAYVTVTDGLDFAQTNNNRQGDVNRGIFTNRLFIDLLSENTLSYNTSFGEHTLSAVGGFTAQKTTIKMARTEATNFPSEYIRTINTALIIVAPSIDVNGNQQGTYTLYNQIGLLSVLGRVNYTYKDRYLLSASFRGDGSSYFAPGKKWGYFPSVSAGWTISKEKFMQQVDWLSNWKLRASWGATGNNKIVDFAFVDLLYPASYPFGSGTGTLSSGQLPSREILANPDITWERTFQYNLGTDFSLFKNALSVSVEYYKSTTEKLLLKQATMSFTGAPQTWNNIGRVQNTGIELEITSNNIRNKNFQWKTTANLAANRNKLLEFGGEKFQNNIGERNEVYNTEIGYSSIRFWGYKTDGVWLSQAEADEAKAKDQGTANATVYYTAGGLKLVDLNGDGKISTDDRTDIGSPFPKFTWGITNTFNYKNFDLYFLFQGVEGLDVINGDAFYNETRKYNNKYNTSGRWVSAANPGDGKTPYLTSGFDWMLTDYVVENGSYWGLREVVLGYKLPEKISKMFKLNGARFYVSAQNLYLHFASGYRGINPEARLTSGNYNNPLLDGYQRGAFPMQRTILFGIDLNF